MASELPKELLGKVGDENGYKNSLREQLRHLEANIIADAVEKYGNARRAALYLKVNPSTICRKLKGKVKLSRHSDANEQHFADIQ